MLIRSSHHLFSSFTGYPVIRPAGYPENEAGYPTGNVQCDQLNMAVFFLDLGKNDLSSVHVYSSVHWTSHFIQGTRKIRPCICLGDLTQRMYPEEELTQNLSRRDRLVDLYLNMPEKVALTITWISWIILNIT